MQDKNPPKSLVLWTLAIFVLIVIGTAFYENSKPVPELNIDIKGQPTIGNLNSSVHVVVFEEPKCVDCKVYNNVIFPKIREEFVDTDKISYTVIPVSFLPHSMPAAAALLCAHHQEQNSSYGLFFDFLNYLYLHQPSEHADWTTVDKLQELARGANPHINLDKLKGCIERNRYHHRIIKNTDYGRTLMGGELSTPSIYVNGVAIEEISLHDIRFAILSHLEKGAKK